MFFQNVHLDDVVIHVRPRGGHFFFGIYISPCQFDETPTLRQAR